jgi:hypothetical protein
MLTFHSLPNGVIVMKTPSRFTILALTLLAVISVYAALPPQSAYVRIRGKVNINGKPAVTGAFGSGGTVKTGKNSSAVVSLGKLGRVEVLPDSAAKIEFADGSVTVTMIEAGRVRVSNSSGTYATVHAGDARISADKSQANEFMVDTSCGNLIVSTKTGMAEIRAGSIVKQVRAGFSETLMIQCK